MKSSAPSGLPLEDFPPCDRPGVPHACPGMLSISGQDTLAGLRGAFDEITANALLVIIYRSASQGPQGPWPWAWVWH